jgi:hypothetical protein
MLDAGEELLLTSNIQHLTSALFIRVHPRLNFCAGTVEQWFAIIPEPCKRAGRAVAAAAVPKGILRERKVRTLQGSEPANGWALGLGWRH